MALALLRAGGADTNSHWAYQAVQRPVVPVVENAGWARSAIDRFILAKLRSNGLEPAPEADRRTWLRRVTFDLTGLPPTPEEVHSFLQNSSPEAFERAADRLLASPRYGARWARHWIDASHYAETHGHDQDRIRTNAWPYRDYLIDSFNADKPYGRFVQEQLAGDVLYPEDPQATVALGFVAAGPWDESSLRDIREDTIDRQIGRYLDRDDMVSTVMQTFTSSTAHCARCHDHKFDPITQRDYYALQAVFAGVDRANRVYDKNPIVHQKRRDLKALLQRVDGGDKALLLSRETEDEVQAWERWVRTQKSEWTIFKPQVYVSTGGATLSLQPDGSILASGPRPDRDTYLLDSLVGNQEISGLRLEVLPHESLPHNGPGRAENGNLHLSEVQVLLFEPGATVAREVPLGRPVADFNQTGWTIAHAVDRSEKTAWGIHPHEGRNHLAIVPFQQPLKLASGDRLVVLLKQLHGEGHLIGRLRLSVTSGTLNPGAELPPTAIENILSRAATERSEQDRMDLAAFVLKERITHALAELPKPSFVYAASSDFEPDGGLKPSGGPRLVQVLKRGDIRKPIETAEPGSLSCIPALASRFELADARNEGARRAALANWLVHPENPLAWRSIVNRIWGYHFGRGLVDTPNDFGRMGSQPSHPELLDWLTVWFRDDAAGSLKRLHRLIVTSAVYRQTVAPRASSAWQMDADNKWLGRMNRSRLDAEQVRDAILQASGFLDWRMGGPSDMQFDLQPGIHVTPRVDYSKFDMNTAAARRRGVYRFLFRTLPDPFMDALDCPAGDQLAPLRNASVTVQQALAMWNNAFIAAYSQRFAERLEASADVVEKQVARGYELALNRTPNEPELRDLSAYARQNGLANFCRLLFNMNEFMFLE